MCKKVKLPEDKNGLTRRDFLTKFSQAAMGVAFLPSVLRSFSSTNAYGATTPTPMAHITFDLFQGDSLISYFPATDVKGQLLTAAQYTAAYAAGNGSGFDPSLLSASGGIVSKYGAPMANTGGGSVTIPTSTGGTVTIPNLPSMLATAGVPAANTASGGVQFATLAATHNNDVGQYYLAGQLVSSYLNAVTTNPFKYVTNPPKAGGLDVEAISGYTPVQINSVGSYQALLGPVGSMNSWGQALAASGTLANSMSSRNLASVSASGAGGGTALSAAMMHGYQANQTTLAAGTSALPTPLTDTRLTGPFGLTTTTSPTSQPAVMASLLKLVLDGQTQAIRFTPAGNFDVHTISGQSEYQQLMNVFQTLIIPTIQTLVNNKVPFWIDITTDGSANWTAPLVQSGTTTVGTPIAGIGTTSADNDGISMEVSIAYVPGMANPMTASFSNGYTTAQVVSTTSNATNTHPLAQGVPNSEINTALLRAASAIKLLTGTDPTAGNSIFSPVAGYLLT